MGNSDKESEQKVDIFKVKRSHKPTDDPNPVRMPGRTVEDIGACWSNFFDTHTGARFY